MQPLRSPAPSSSSPLIRFPIVSSERPDIRDTRASSRGPRHIARGVMTGTLYSSEYGSASPPTLLPLLARLRRKGAGRRGGLRSFSFLGLL